MDREKTNTVGKVSLCAAVGGVVGGVALGLLFTLIESLSGITLSISLCVLLFVGLELVALAAGIMGWRSPYGKAGAGASVLLLGLILFFVPVSSTRENYQGTGPEPIVETIPHSLSSEPF